MPISFNAKVIQGTNIKYTRRRSKFGAWVSAKGQKSASVTRKRVPAKSKKCESGFFAALACLVNAIRLVFRLVDDFVGANPWHHAAQFFTDDFDRMLGI